MDNKVVQETKAPSSVEELLSSEWAEEAKKVEVTKKLIAQLPILLTHLGNTKVGNNARIIFDVLQKHMGGKTLLSPRNLLLIVASLLYLLSPIDAIPDVIPVIGLLDDLGVLVLVINAVQAELAQLGIKITTSDVLEDVPTSKKGKE